MKPTKYHQGRFPPTDLDLNRLLPLIGPASGALARFDGVLSAVPNANVLLSPLTTQEAVLSSKIEGTQATMGEVLEFEAGDEAVSEEKKADIYEVLNYRRALNGAVEEMQTLPLSQRLIRNAHHVLMQGVRGSNKTPGEYRRIPNWIGPAGCDVDGATYVPPGADQVSELMTAWERYIHSDQPDQLIQLAVIHVEFEAIHPFLDGNGRLGRLLVPLFLVDKKVLPTPNFYISAFFDAHREEYYERLLAVSRDGDWTGWCAFFLRAITEQSRDNAAKAKAILDLYHTQQHQVTELTRSRYATYAVDFLFRRPIFKASDFYASDQIPDPTARRILKVLIGNRILKTLRRGSGRRPAVLAFSRLLNIAEGKDAF